MHFPPYFLSPHNSHYEGAYSDRELRWRAVCARDKAHNMQAMLDVAGIGEVLEVGCGTGAVLVQLASQGVGQRHVGIDLADPREHSDPAIKQSGIELLHYDGEHLPFGDSSFDLVFASHVVEHVPNPRGFIQQLARVAKRHIYLEVPCELHLRTSRNSLQSTLDIGHINAYTPESFVLLIQTAGLHVLRTGLFDHSADVHAFNGSPLLAAAKRIIRGGLLKASPQWASRVFTYHFGVLCEVDQQRHRAGP